MKSQVADLKKTEKIAKDLAKNTLNKKQLKTAQVIGLVGELGGGKTTFSQFFAKALGVKEKVQSPTFVLMKKYKIRKKNFVHIDAYRIKKTKELLDLGWRELISDPKNIILVEWADRIQKILPKGYVQIKFEVVDENKRKITI